MYPLDEVLLLCLLAVLARAEAFTDIGVGAVPPPPGGLFASPTGPS